MIRQFKARLMPRRRRNAGRVNAICELGEFFMFLSSGDQPAFLKAEIAGEVDNDNFWEIMAPATPQFFLYLGHLMG
jgi:hypothetical protein